MNDDDPQYLSSEDVQNLSSEDVQHVTSAPQHLHRMLMAQAPEVAEAEPVGMPSDPIKALAKQMEPHPANFSLSAIVDAAKFLPEPVRKGTETALHFPGGLIPEQKYQPGAGVLSNAYHWTLEQLRQYGTVETVALMWAFKKAPAALASRAASVFTASIASGTIDHAIKAATKVLNEGQMGEAAWEAASAGVGGALLAGGHVMQKAGKQVVTDPETGGAVLKNEPAPAPTEADVTKVLEARGVDTMNPKESLQAVLNLEGLDQTVVAEGTPVVDQMRPQEPVSTPLAEGEVPTLPSKVAPSAPLTPSPAMFQRIEEPGTSPGDPSKPQGLYVSDAAVKSPHQLGGERSYWSLDPEANVLDVTAELPFALRKGAIDVSAGTQAAKKLLPPEVWESLRTKEDVIAYLEKNYPGPNYRRAGDKQDALDYLGAQEARRAGYDAIRDGDIDAPEFSETVLLNPEMSSPASPESEAPSAEVTVRVGAPISKTEGTDVTLEDGRPTQALHEGKHVAADVLGTAEPVENNQIIAERFMEDNGQRLLNPEQIVARPERPPKSGEQFRLPFTPAEAIKPVRPATGALARIKAMANAIHAGTFVEGAADLISVNLARGFLGRGNKSRDMMNTDSGLEAYRLHFNRKFTPDQQIEMQDLITAGRPVSDPMAREAFDTIRRSNNEYYYRAKSYLPDLAFRPDYLTRIWETAPADSAALFENHFNNKTMSGGKGWTYERYYKYLRDGIAAGGKLISTNPIELAKIYWESVDRTIAKEHAKVSAVANGRGSNNPKEWGENWEPVRNAAFDEFPGYKFEPSFALMLNRFLSAGPGRVMRGMLATKQFYTAIELFSTFHAATVTNEAMAQQTGYAVGRAYNDFVDWAGGRSQPVEVDPRPTLAYLERFAKIPSVPVEMYRLGKLYRSSQDGFFSRVESRPKIEAELVKRLKELGVGEPGEEIKAFYTSAAARQLQSAGMRMKAAQGFKEAMMQRTPTGAVLRGLGNLPQNMMSWLFDKYIPRLKTGAYFMDLAERYRYEHNRLDAGEVTKDQLRREAWDAMENRYGEMDFSNLWWTNRTKAAMQIMFRSILWKYGSLRQYKNSIFSQAEEVWNAGKESRLPRMTPDMQWAIGSVLVHMAEATAIQYAFIHEAPTGLDFFFPRIGGKDRYGNDNRMVPPGYLKDIAHLAHSPGDYVLTGMSGILSGLGDVVRGHDIYGKEIKGPVEIGKRLIPKPIAFSSMKAAQQSAESPAAAGMAWAGFVKAPAYITRNEFQQDIMDESHKIIRLKSPEQADMLDKLRQAELEYRNTGKYPDMSGQNIPPNMIVNSMKRSKNDDPLRSMMKSIPYGKLVEIFTKANDEQLRKYYGELAKKTAAGGFQRVPPKSQASVQQMLKEIVTRYRELPQQSLPAEDEPQELSSAE